MKQPHFPSIPPLFLLRSSPTTHTAIPLADESVWWLNCLICGVSVCAWVFCVWTRAYGPPGGATGAQLVERLLSNWKIGGSISSLAIFQSVLGQGSEPHRIGPSVLISLLSKLILLQVDIYNAISCISLTDAEIYGLIYPQGFLSAVKHACIPSI